LIANVPLNVSLEELLPMAVAEMEVVGKEDHESLRMPPGIALARVHKQLARTHKSLPTNCKTVQCKRSRIVSLVRSIERKPILNYQFSQEEVTLIRLALGIALKQFEDCLEGEAPQMLAYINQSSWSEASQTARTMIEQLSVPGLVLTINAQRRRN